MAVAESKIQAGVTLYYYRYYRGRMGNTTMKEVREGSIHILSVDAEKRTAKVRSISGESTMSFGLIRKRYFSWSMHNKDEAIQHRSAMLNHVMEVERRKPCKKCKKRHAAETCPDPVGDAIRSILET